MRRIEPPRNEHNYLRQPMTAGEKRVLDFFDEHLPPEWEIYIQPHLNGLRPDFVIMNPDVGIHPPPGEEHRRPGHPGAARAQEARDDRRLYARRPEDDPRRQKPARAVGASAAVLRKQRLSWRGLLSRSRTF